MIYLITAISIISALVFLSMVISGKSEDEYRKELVEEMRRGRRL